MDLVTRLKEFLTHSGISITQFADTCDIPRPTLSQILNGRNKKVSDEIISKIHSSFPELSIYWLLFGEGNIESSSNTQISESSNKMKLNNGLPSTLFNIEDMNRKENLTDSKRMQNEKKFIKNNNTIELSSQNKSITSIVVYYDDKSYQYFYPG